MLNWHTKIYFAQSITLTFANNPISIVLQKSSLHDFLWYSGLQVILFIKSDPITFCENLKPYNEHLLTIRILSTWFPWMTEKVQIIVRGGYYEQLSLKVVQLWIIRMRVVGEPYSRCLFSCNILHWLIKKWLLSKIIQYQSICSLPLSLHNHWNQIRDAYMYIFLSWCLH